MRIAFAAFGVVTPVLSVVVSVFMSGLFAGTWMAGRYIGPLTRFLRLPAVWIYALAELLIGAGAFAVPRLLSFGERALLPVAGIESAAYLWWSALIIAASVLPWCVCMGTGLPILLAHVKERNKAGNTCFSLLYSANVIGAMCGTAATALVLIELLGFRNTLLAAAIVNLLISSVAAILGLRARGVLSPAEESPQGFWGEQPSPPEIGASVGRAGTLLFITGFTSMAMEVVWTRAFAVVLQTQVYSFAMLLFTYLLATLIGSLRYRRDTRSKRVIPEDRLVAWVAAAGTLPIIANDPRLLLDKLGILASIFPFCALLGYLTPGIIDRYARGDPRRAGFSYALNILGCMLGPLAASYIILPVFDLKVSLLILVAPYPILLLSRLRQTSRRELWVMAIPVIVVITLSRTYEDQIRQMPEANAVIRHDHTATTISCGRGFDKKLIVNGVSTTHLTPITKIMAHLPLAHAPQKPGSALVICLGMGTTFRSLASWGIDATAVELVPGVEEAFPYYFDDAKQLIGSSKGKILVDDGRRYLRRTGDYFDVITLDPPPPVEAAGSSLLYSEEFYTAAKRRLKPGGILQQWFPGGEDRITWAVARSFANSFPFIKVYRSYQGWGYHFLGSLQPIQALTPEDMANRMPAGARADLIEWGPFADAAPFLNAIVRQEVNPALLLRRTESITDDRPFNEYFLLRRAFSPSY